MCDNDNPRCYLTHVQHNLVRHHVMNGRAERKKAEEDGLWVYLSDPIHRYLHETSEGRQKMNELKAEA